MFPIDPDAFNYINHLTVDVVACKCVLIFLEFFKVVEYELKLFNR